MDIKLTQKLHLYLIQHKALHLFIDEVESRAIRNTMYNPNIRHSCVNNSLHWTNTHQGAQFLEDIYEGFCAWEYR